MQTLGKNERLKSRKAIDLLFREGHTEISYPLRAVYTLKAGQDKFPLKAGVSVPKKFIRRAVKRNLLKRRSREAFRLHKDPLVALLHNRGLGMDILFVYLGKEIADYERILQSMMVLLDRVSKKVSRQPLPSTDTPLEP